MRTFKSSKKTKPYILIEKPAKKNKDKTSGPKRPDLKLIKSLAIYPDYEKTLNNKFFTKGYAPITPKRYSIWRMGVPDPSTVEAQIEIT